MLKQGGIKMNGMQKIFLVVWTPVFFFMLLNCGDELLVPVVINVSFMVYVWFCFGDVADKERIICRFLGGAK